MDADEFAAKELKEHKDYPLSASIGERAGERCRIPQSSLNQASLP